MQISPEALLSSTKHSSGKANSWHQRYGHSCINYLKKLKNDNLLSDFNISKKRHLDFVKGVFMANNIKTHFPKDGGTRATYILKLVHSDVNGPMKTRTHEGTKYFVLFIDDFTRKNFMYFLTQKSEVFEKLKEFKAFVKNERDCQIQTLRSNKQR